MIKHKDIWNQFCEKEQVIAQSVPLFDCYDDLHVQTKKIGKNSRLVLSRSDAMEKLVIDQVDLLIPDNVVNEEYDGLIYMMFHRVDDNVLPLYIGKTESKGRKNNVSANVKNIRSNKNNFARWGHNYQYHIGDLSAVTLYGHPEKEIKDKYSDWAKLLFTQFPTNTPQLKAPVYFWCKAWKAKDVGIWKGFGETRLTFLEYLMIGVASSAFPHHLLNREGKSR